MDFFLKKKKKSEMWKRLQVVFEPELCYIEQ